MENADATIHRQCHRDPGSNHGGLLGLGTEKAAKADGKAKQKKRKKQEDASEEGSDGDGSDDENEKEEELAKQMAEVEAEQQRKKVDEQVRVLPDDEISRPPDTISGSSDERGAMR